MKVSDIQDVAPKAAVYELRSDAKYLILLDPNYVASSQMRSLQHVLNGIKVTAGIAVVENSDTVRFLEFDE
jgi:hypothetical protein